MKPKLHAAHLNQNDIRWLQAIPSVLLQMDVSKVLIHICRDVRRFSNLDGCIG